LREASRAFSGAAASETHRQRLQFGRKSSDWCLHFVFQNSVKKKLVFQKEIQAFLFMV